jgi:hypothetical protein
MLIVLLWCWLAMGLAASCEDNCESCRNLFAGDYACLACKAGYELVTTYNICIQDITIDHCALYDQTLDCLSCQPTYAQSVNLCSKSYNGCLQQTPSACALCLPGSFLNPDSQTCAVSLLHCRNLDLLGACAACYPGYTLLNGRCQDKNPECALANRDTGLCSDCAAKQVMVGYVCLPGDSPVVANCYMVEKSNNFTCTYCKAGYGPFFGTCLSLQNVLQQVTFSQPNCSSLSYLKDNQVSCLTSNGADLAKCLRVDFGFGRCLLCEAMYMLDDSNKCVPVLASLCATNLSALGECLSCK